MNHPECARVLAMHRGVGGVLGPFTCGFRAGVDGERVGVSGAGMAAAGEVSRAARWQKLSGTEVRPAGAGVAVAVGMAAARRVWQWQA